MGGLLNAIAQGPNSVNYYADQAAQVKQRQAQTAATLAGIPAAQAEAQQQQLKNQQMQMDMQDTATTRQFLQKHNGDFKSMLADPDFLGAVQPHVAMGIQKSVLDNQKTIADTSKLTSDAQEAAAKAQAAHVALSGDMAYSVAKANYSPAVLDAVMSEMVAKNLMDPQHAQMITQTVTQDPSKIKPIIDQLAANSPARIKDMEAEAASQNATTNTAKEARELAQQKFEQAQKLRGQGIQASAGLENKNLPLPQGQAMYQQWAQQYPDLAKITGPEWNPDAMARLQRQAVPVEKQPGFDIEKASADAMKTMTPQNWMDEVAGTGAKPGSPLYQSTVAAVQASIQRGDFKGAQQALRDAREELSGTRKAVATVQAEMPIRLAEAASNRGAALDVEKFKTASAAYNKSGLALAGAVTAADDVQKILDMTGAGNKAAAANVPLVGVGALNAVNGIKRINSAEIAQYGTAGSLVDRIQGKLQGWTEGQPIPKDVLNDMKSLHEQLANGAYEKHAREVETINKTYGQSFKPMEFAKPAAAKGSAVPTPKSQSEFDALAKGAQFMKPGDPKVYVKQ